jgi:hypothetical protein
MSERQVRTIGPINNLKTHGNVFHLCSVCWDYVRNYYEMLRAVVECDSACRNLIYAVDTWTFGIFKNPTLDNLHTSN